MERLGVHAAAGTLAVATPAAAYCVLACGSTKVSIYNLLIIHLTAILVAVLIIVIIIIIIIIIVVVILLLVV